MKRKAIILATVASLLLIGGAAEAKTDRELTYGTSQIWRSMVRFLRVDQHYKIVEKDKESGYLLFEYKDEGRSHMASMEVVETIKDNRYLVRASLRIESMPSYVESVLIDKFVKKLKEEYGAAPPARVVRQEPDPSEKKDEEAAGNADLKDGADDEEDLEITEDDLNGSVKEND